MEVTAYLHSQTTALIQSLLIEYSPPLLAKILSNCVIKLSENQLRRVIEIGLLSKKEYGLLWKMRYALAYSINSLSVRLGFSTLPCFSLWVNEKQRSPLYDCSILITDYHPEVDFKNCVGEKTPNLNSLVKGEAGHSKKMAEVAKEGGFMNLERNFSVSLSDLAQLIGVEDCDDQLARLAYAEKNFAVWIIDQATQEVLLANRVALDANCKPPREILTKDVSVLWDEEPLRELTDLVHRDKRVSDHTNTGYRWRKEEGSNIWMRVRHHFTVDYAEITFLGQVCRFEIVKEAVPV